MNRFVIISEPRSGSEYLSGLLRRCEYVECKAEIFQHFDMHSSLKIQLQHLNDEFDDIDDGDISSGVKLMFWRDIYPKNNKNGLKLLKYCSKHNIKIINLKRKNILNQYISLKDAIDSNIWHIRKNNLNEYVQPKYELNLEDVIQHMEMTHDRRRCWDDMIKGISYKDLWYEDLVENEAKIMKALYDYIGIDSKSIEFTSTSNIKTYKQHSENYNDYIVNYNEISNLLPNFEY